MTFDADAYLDRIGLTERPTPDLDGLERLQTAHLLSVPFENTDIALGRGIDLDPDHLFDKIVDRQRGGYCFELNGLYGQLLDALGFVRRPTMARVWYRSPPEVPAQTHTLNIVTLDGRDYMTDVGFGGTTARIPVPLAEGDYEDSDGALRIRHEAPFGYFLSRRTPDGWVDQFSTTGATAYPSDFRLGSHFMSTHPDSHFRHNLLIGRFTPEGRTTLVGRTLTRRRGWDLQVDEIADLAVFRAALRDDFGLNPGGELETLYDTLPQRG
jgi:N-hydroxyarylamine O-acetyltransferase